MKKRVISLMLAAVMLLSILPVLSGRSALAASAAATYDSISGSANEVACYEYFTRELGLTSASACGIMANIYRESSFDPSVVSSAGAMGLCQWMGGRKSALIEYCEANGYDPYSLDGQLNYLAHELTNSYPDIFAYMQGVEESANGAYDAGYYWCYYYERPANKESNSVKRGELARDSFYPVYGNGNVTPDNDPSTLTINATNYPSGELKAAAFNLGGDISSNYTLNKVTGSILKADGTVVQTVTDTPGAKTYSIGNSPVDNGLRFGQLEAGYYMVRYEAEDSSGEARSWTSPVFALSTSAKTVKLFQDLAAGQWYYTSVYTLADREIIYGFDAGDGQYVFQPEGNLTRAQAVALIYRMAGSPTPTITKTPFSDARDSWYQQALLWAVEEHITAGTTATTFSPNQPVTRQEFAAFLYRACGGEAGSCVNLEVYADVNDVSSWAKQPMSWCVTNGIISSTQVDELVLAPTDTATRAQASIMLEQAEPLFQADAA